MALVAGGAMCSGRHHSSRVTAGLFPRYDELLLLLHTHTSSLECWSTVRGRDPWLLSDW